MGWPWIFLINLPFGLAAFVAALRIVPRTERPVRRRLDWAGFGLVGIGLAALVLGMEQIGSDPTPWAWMAGYLAAAAAALVSSVVWMRRARHPLLDFHALRIHTFRVGNIGGGVYRLIISAAPFLFTLLFQVGFGWSAARAGLLVGAVFVGNIVIKPATTPLIRRFGFKAVIVWSNALGAVVYLLCVFVDPSTPVAVIALLLFFSGVFRSIGFSGYNSLQFADVPTELTTSANTLASTMQQVATGLGVAVAALIVRATTFAAEGVGPADAWLGYRWALPVVALLLMFPLIEAALMPRHAGAAAVRR